MLSNKGDTERRVVCPYNKAHTLLHYRVQDHLVKCRRNHPESKKVTCLYNATHRVPEPELTYHLEVCADRGNLDKFMHTTETSNPDKYLLPQAEVTPTDNWDDEPPTASYNPDEYCQKNAIIRSSVVQTQSQAVRRNFRMEERQRMQELMNQQAAAKEKQNQKDFIQRHPVQTSEGIQNRAEIVENDPVDIENLLARVNMGSSTLTTPGLSAKINIREETWSRVEEPVHRREDAVVEDHTWPSARSTVAGLRRRAFSHNVHATTGRGPSMQNVSCGPNGSAESDFAQLRQPMHTANDILRRPVGRGRGSRLQRK